VKASDIVALPIQLGSAVRRRRVFHPIGVLANGSIERLAPPGEGLPVQSSDDVVGRVSKGIGLPGALPDIIGLAIRMPPQPFAATSWDVLMASAGAGTLTRMVLRPVTSWTGATLSSLMPLRYEDRNWWVRARIVTQIDEPGLSLDSVSAQIDGGGIEFAIEQAPGMQDFQPLARLILNEVVRGGRSHDVAFDPTVHSVPEVKLAPGWLTDLRRRAYWRSREGRDAD
jgi:hypothetical protein